MMLFFKSSKPFLISKMGKNTKCSYAPLEEREREPYYKKLIYLKKKTSKKILINHGKTKTHN